jgi:hypothetical protein
MAKISGLSWTTLSIDNGAGAAKDLRNDITNFEFATPRATQDTTGVDKAAFERLLLLADFSITVNGVFNADADKSHQTLKDVSSDNDLRTVSLGIASQTLACECLFTDYALTRADSGEFTFSAPGVLANGAVPTWA